MIQVRGIEILPGTSSLQVAFMHHPVDPRTRAFRGHRLPVPHSDSPGQPMRSEPVVSEGRPPCRRLVPHPAVALQRPRYRPSPVALPALTLRTRPREAQTRSVLPAGRVQADVKIGPPIRRWATTLDGRLARGATQAGRLKTLPGGGVYAEPPIPPPGAFLAPSPNDQPKPPPTTNRGNLNALGRGSTPCPTSPGRRGA